MEHHYRIEAADEVDVERAVEMAGGRVLDCRPTDDSDPKACSQTFRYNVELDGLNADELARNYAQVWDSIEELEADTPSRPPSDPPTRGSEHGRK